MGTIERPQQLVAHRSAKAALSAQCKLHSHSQLRILIDGDDSTMALIRQPFERAFNCRGKGA